MRELAAVVPFRLTSQRFPDKPLARFRGLPLIEHALASARRLAETVVLTGPAEDLDRVTTALPAIRGQARLVPSPAACRSGTERLVAIFPGLDARLFLTIPVDEPTLDAGEIARALRTPGLFDGSGIVTFTCPFFAPQDYLTPLSAKVVTDRAGRLLYMSRAAIPVRKDGTVDPAALGKHVGAFVFTRDALEKLATLAGVPTRLDRLEGLEQLRWLELGLSVSCVPIRHIGFGIDVPEQLALLEERMACSPPRARSG
jgi:3-deoxy-manno-octulosonate cytidylyltransferase (CMP-KDO synthetase)